MAIIDFYTVKFTNMGQVKCRTCGHMIVFEGERSNWLMLYDLRFPAGKMMVSADTLAVVHECGQEHTWMCPGCGSTDEWWGRRPRKSRKQWAVPRCAVCHIDMRQTKVRVQQDVA